MFSELPKLIGRDFAIAYFIPSAILVISLDYVFTRFGLNSIIDESHYQKWLGVAVYVLIIWSVSVVLMAINYSLIRFMEGYGRLNPLQLRRSIIKRRFREYALPALNEADMIDEARKKSRPVPKFSEGFIDRLRLAVSNFPHDERLLLPTMLGNSIRAFEVYSRVVYGIDAIPAWPRLFVLLPEQVRNQLNYSKAVFDFAVNLSFTSLLIIIVYAALSVWSPFIALWIPLLYGSIFCSQGICLMYRLNSGASK